MFASQMYNVFSKALIKNYHENFNITCTSGYAQHNNKLKILQIKFIDNFVFCYKYHKYNDILNIKS